MRLVLKFFFYAAAITALCWLVPQIAAGFHRATAAGSTPDVSRAYALFSVYLIVGAALAMFVAWDVSRFLGGQAGQLFWSGGRVASITPAWWKAERLCKDRQPLEAVHVLRDYLDAHPRQWRVAVRIAEIYQNEIKDPLPAALEYEKILSGRLPNGARPEVLLRLAACQLLLRRHAESAMALREVLEKYPGTDAAQKAERRLKRIERGDPFPTQEPV